MSLDGRVPGLKLWVKSLSSEASFCRVQKAKERCNSAELRFRVSDRVHWGGAEGYCLHLGHHGRERWHLGFELGTIILLGSGS